MYNSEGRDRIFFMTQPADDILTSCLRIEYPPVDLLPPLNSFHDGRDRR